MQQRTQDLIQVCKWETENKGSETYESEAEKSKIRNNSLQRFVKAFTLLVITEKSTQIEEITVDKICMLKMLKKLSLRKAVAPDKFAVLIFNEFMD